MTYTLATPVRATSNPAVAQSVDVFPSLGVFRTSSTSATRLRSKKFSLEPGEFSLQLT